MLTGKFKFYTEDTEYSQYNNSIVEIVRLPADDEYDLEDVGQMYVVILVDDKNVEFEVFEDELLSDWS